MAGIEGEINHSFKSLVPLMKGENCWNNETISEIIIPGGYHKLKYPVPVKMIKKDQYKLFSYCINGKFFFSLYDLENDPDEISDLSENKDHLNIFNELKEKLLENWQIERNLDCFIKNGPSNKMMFSLWNNKQINAAYYPEAGYNDNNVIIYNEE